MHRRLPLILLLAALAAARAAEPGDELERARALQLAHQPREAIAAYVALIDAHRFALARSVPALTGLVDSYQMLASDPAVGEEYARVAEKYLAKPPALDGAAKLDPKAAREDLLWKPWTAEATTSLAITLANARRSLTKEHDVPVRHLQLSFKADAGDGLQFQSDPLASSGGKATVTIGDRKLPAQVSAFAMMGLMINVNVDGIPAGLERVDRLEATVPVTAVIGRTLVEKPLRAGETWADGDSEYRIQSFKAEGGGHQLVLASGTRAKRKPGGLAMASAAGGMGGDREGFCWLKTADGGEIHSNSLSSSSSNGAGEATLGFPAGGEPVALVVCTGTETSTHDVRIVLTDLALP